ncbi:ABC transporter permease [candidate division KSB1 bacterium]
MIKNYIKMAFRNMMKQRAFSFINLFGLAVGMACCILILLYVKDELSYDKYHENSDNIYRITTEGQIGGANRHFALCPGAAAPIYMEEIPEVLNFTRVINLQIQQQGQTLILYEGKSFEEEGILFVDSTFFKLFSCEFVMGDPATAINRPNTIVITEETASRIFGDENPMGKILQYNQLGEASFEVTGVIRNVPRNSHFSFNYLIPVSTFPPQLRLATLASWLNVSGYSYMLLEENADIESIEATMAEILENRTGQAARQYNISLKLHLQKMTDIHLNSNLEFEHGANNDIKYIYIFSAIAAFILIIACINFMNLSTAKSSNRAKEVGMRKVFGAFKGNLITQFLSESILMALLSFILASIIVLAVLPEFNSIADKELGLASLNNIPIIAGIIGIIAFTGIIAGSYPAFFLSAFRPVAVLKGFMSKGGGITFRKVLVVLQFSISIALIISTIVVLRQLEYMKNKNLGFDKEQIVVIAINDPQTVLRYRTVKQELKTNSNIIDVSYCSSVPGRSHTAPLFIPEGKTRQDGAQVFDNIFVDTDFVKTYGMEIIYGRDFSIDFPSDTAGAFIINETAANDLGWGPDAVDKELTVVIRQGITGKIVGIVKDFHSKSVKLQIEPTILMVAPFFTGHISIRFNTENTSETIQFIRDKFKELEPTRELDYFFLDEDFDRNYRAEERLSTIFLYFAWLAIIIACLGLFGLASFTAEQRIKEIGIRKTLGATVNNIVVQLSNDFIKWVLIANVIAWPITYYLMTTIWLVNFPYRISMSVLTFVISGLVSVLIAILTVMYQSIKAATTNPVNALRYE